MSDRRSLSVFGLLAAFVLVVAMPAFAGEGHSHGDAKAKAQEDAAMAEMMKYAAPGEIHAFLKPMEGKWKTMNTMYMGDQKQTTEGTCERTWIMGGRFLQSKYTGTMGEGMPPFEGLEILGYDTRSKMIQSTWMDNMATHMATSSKGTIDTAKKTMTVYTDFFDPMTNKPKTYKMVTTFIDNDNCKFMMVGNKDGKDFTEMEIVYTRVN